jgi:hypothetical protein
MNSGSWGAIAADPGAGICGESEELTHRNVLFSPWPARPYRYNSTSVRAWRNW